MTISTLTSSNTFVGTGTNGPFPCNFRIFSDSDPAVSLIDTTSGITTNLVLNSDYTIVGAGDQNGFTLSTTNAVPVGKNLLVSRTIPIDQPTDFTNQGAFFPTLHEDMADRIVMQVQQINHQVGLSLTMPDGLSPSPTNKLPFPLPGSLLGWAQDGLSIVNLGPSGVGAGSIVDANVSNTAGVQASKLNFTQAGTGAQARTVQSKLGDTVSIKDFGAVCDGVHDDSVAINNALASGASRVRFIGTCLVSKPLYYPSNIIIEFDQGASVIPVALASFQKLTLNGLDWGYAIFMNVNWQASVLTDSNVTFINPRCTPSGAWNGHFIGSRKLSNMQVIGSYCVNMADVVSSMGCVDVLVKDGWCNNISNCAYDFWEGPARITVVNCTTINSNAGVNFNSVDTYNNGPFTADTLLVQGCRFYSSATSAVYVAPLGNTSFCTNIKILDNFIDQANTATGTGGGGRVWNGITVQRASVIDIRGNTMNRIGSGAAPIIVTTDAGGASQQTLIVDNTVNNSTLGASGFYIQCYGANSKVWNNRALNSTATGGVGIAVNDPTSVVGPNLMAGASTYLVNQNPGGGATSAALQLDQNTTVPGGRWDTPQPIRAQAFQPGVSYAITATGTTSGTALQLTKPFNYVNGGAANSGVMLPQNTGNRAGEEWIVWNQSGNTILVYPWPGDTIGGSGSLSVSTSTKVRLVAITGTLWIVA